MMSKDNGLTLIELMIAILVLSVILIVSYRGLGNTLQLRRELLAYEDEWRSIELVLENMESNFQNAIPSAGVDGGGERISPFILNAKGTGNYDAILELTRAPALSSYNAYGVSSRVGYRLTTDGVLEILQWSTAFPSPQQLPSVGELLKNVDSLQISAYRNNSWIPVIDNSIALAEGYKFVPNALKMSIKIKGGEEISRTFYRP